MFNITLSFKNEKDANKWLEWWLDSGGEQDFEAETDMNTCRELSDDWNRLRYPMQLVIKDPERG